MFILILTTCVLCVYAPVSSRASLPRDRAHASQNAAHATRTPHLSLAYLVGMHLLSEQIQVKTEELKSVEAEPLAEPVASPGDGAELRAIKGLHSPEPFLPATPERPAQPEEEVPAQPGPEVGCSLTFSSSFLRISPTRYIKYQQKNRK